MNKKQLHIIWLRLSILFIGIFIGWSPYLISVAARQDEEVARVNNVAIRQAMFELALESELEKLELQGMAGKQIEEVMGQVKSSVLARLIDDELIAQRARQLGLDNVEAEVEQLLKLSRNICNLRPNDYEEESPVIELQPEIIRAIIRSRLLTSAVLGREVYSPIMGRLSRVQLWNYYRSHISRFILPGTVTLSRIYISFGTDRSKSLETALAIAAEARRDIETFADLARRHSEEAIGQKGGVIGEMEITGLSPDLRSAVENAAIGTITEPITADGGYVIWRVDGRQEPSPLRFESDEVQEAVKQGLAFELGEPEKERYLSRLRSQAKIETVPPKQ
jgi:parvulin-like peptidyl-prolyl isomerase